MIETLRHIDHMLFHFINHDLANPVFDVLCPWLREKYTWLPFYVVAAYLLFRKYGARNMLIIVAIGALTIVGSDQGSNLIKHFVHRLRPCNNPALEGGARLLLESCGVGYSFVSAHAANHFALATLLSFFVNRNRVVIVLLYLWAASIALSQVYVGVHYPADIFAGALLGLVIGFLLGKLAVRLMGTTTNSPNNSIP